MRTLRRIAVGVIAALTAVGYVWVAGVRAVPWVRRRKAADRARRRSGV